MEVEGVQGLHTPPPPSLPEMTCGFLIKVAFCQEKKNNNNNNKYETKLKSFLSVAHPSKKNPGSAPGHEVMNTRMRNELLSAG